MLLLQEGTGQADRDIPETPPSSAPAGPDAEPAAETTRFSELIASGEYVPLPQADLIRLQNLQQMSQEPTAPAVRTARYSAQLQGRSLVSGSVQFTLSNPDKAATDTGLLLGRTSLQQLQLHDPGGPVLLA
ncbi:MAG: hypothetical protein ACKPJJ_18140, partial [Planctomycetaceae bacterium]